MIRFAKALLRALAVVGVLAGGTLLVVWTVRWVLSTFPPHWAMAIMIGVGVTALLTALFHQYDGEEG